MENQKMIEGMVADMFLSFFFTAFRKVGEQGIVDIGDIHDDWESHPISDVLSPRPLIYMMVVLGSFGVFNQDNENHTLSPGPNYDAALDRLNEAVED